MHLNSWAENMDCFSTSNLKQGVTTVADISPEIKSLTSFIKEKRRQLIRTALDQNPTFHALFLDPLFLSHFLPIDGPK
jgi:hypothetical protein